MDHNWVIEGSARERLGQVTDRREISLHSPGQGTLLNMLCQLVVSV